MTRAPSCLRTVPWLLLAALACGHEEPLAPRSGGATGPHAPGNPLRLTYASGYETTPVWLPDGGILHSFDRTLNARFDRCLGILPGGGGSRTWEFCGAGAGSGDSLDALEGAGASPGGRLIVLWSQSRGTPTTPSRSQVVLASLERPWDYRTLTLAPYTLPGARLHSRPARVDWLDEDRAIYLGEEIINPRDCSNCVPDTVRIGREGVLVNLSGPSPSLSIIPGTQDASSLAAAPGSDWLYLTFPLDTRVYRLPVSGGVPEMVHDFAPDVVRDVALRGDRLYVILGGRIIQDFDEALGTWLVDYGGRLAVLDLVGGFVNEIPVGGDRLLRHPYPDPGGSGGVVVEGYPFSIQQFGDTAFSRVPDLWRYEDPVTVVQEVAR